MHIAPADTQYTFRVTKNTMLAWLLGRKPLWELCSIGERVQVIAAIERGEDVNGKSPCGKTGLMLAVERGHNLVVNLLLQQPRIDVNCYDNGGDGALDTACLMNNAEAVRMLVNHPTMSSLNLWTHSGDFPLMIAVKHGYVECARVLVALPGQNMQKREQREPQRSVLEVARYTGFIKRWIASFLLQGAREP